MRILAILLQRRLGDTGVITLLARNGDFIFPALSMGPRLSGVYDSREVHSAMAEALRRVAASSPEVTVEEVYERACLACFAAVREKIFGRDGRTLN